MTEPLTPTDCDLRDFAFMPLDVVRLLDSDLFALATGDEFKAAIALWCKAWQQIPAGSVPDDDRVLAHLSGAGARWKRIKDMALRNFVKCSDGRLYHSTLCEKANEAWAKKQSYRERSKKGNSKRWASQKDEQQHSLSDPLGMAGGVLEPPKGQGEGEGDIPLGKPNGRDELFPDLPTASQADPDKAFWDNAKTYLGASKASKIGQWCRDFGKDRTAAAIAQSQVERAVEPIAFIEATLRRGPTLRAVGGQEWESPC